MIDTLAPEEVPSLAIDPSFIQLLIDEINCLIQEQNTYFSPKEENHTQHYAEAIEHLAMAAETVGLSGFQEVCLLIAENAQTLNQEKKISDKNYSTFLSQWPILALKYLESINTTTSHALASHLLDEQWPMPLIEQDIQPISELLSSPVISTEKTEKPSRKIEATPQDISLALPQDVNNDLLETLLQELPLQTADFSSAIQKLIKGEGSLEDVDTAQRVAHSLKGAANTVGITGIANLTHHLEDILQALAENRSLPSATIADMLLRAGDCLEGMSEALTEAGSAPIESQEILQEILDWANKIDEKGIEIILSDATPILKTPIPAVNPTKPEPQIQPENTTRLSRVPTELLDDLLRLSGENVTLIRQTQEHTRQIMTYAKALKKKEKIVQQLITELEQLVTIKNLSSHSEQLLLHSDDNQFDVLELEHYNELNSCTNRLEEATMDSAEINNQLTQKINALLQLSNKQERLQKENQEVVFRSRMIPASSITPRLERAVRQACRLIQHDVELKISGEKTLIDSEILNKLVDPLMHLLRNAVDHGIGSPEARKKVGKNPTGEIKLDFSRKGNHISICCEDDGAGLDLEAIHKKALQKELISEHHELSQSDLEQLILIPGFSTRETTTQVSGRGVGMDAVYSNIKEMKGNLLLNSTQGEGLAVTLTLPVSQLFIHALCAHGNAISVALSNRNIERILPAGTGVITHNESKLTYHLENENYPAQLIETLLGVPFHHKEHDLSNHPVLLVKKNNETTHAILASAFENSREMVVKNLGRHLPEIPGIIGVTIGNGGEVMTVIDLPDFLDFSQHKTIRPLHVNSIQTAATHLPKALIVDDSLSARRALSGFMTDIGFDVQTAINGFDALRTIEAQKPDILIVDLEMPRMNGIELTEHLRAKEATKNLPIIMITSRATSKHKEYAKRLGVDVYLTKPYQENELSESINALLYKTEPA